MSHDPNATRNTAFYAGGKKFETWKDWSLSVATYYLPPNTADWSENPSLKIPLANGMLYFNTTREIYRVYINGAWQDSDGNSADHVLTGLWSFIQMPVVGPSSYPIMPAGGLIGQVLGKTSGADWDTQWNNPPADGFVGPAGVFGPPGSSTQWFTVTAIPDVSIGVDDDYAINSVNGDFFRKISGAWVLQGNLQGPIGGGGGTNNHSALVNLTSDDHAQYFNTFRGDARYYEQSILDIQLSSKAGVVHTHTESAITDLDKYTQAQTDAFLSAKSNTGHTHDTSEVGQTPVRVAATNTTLQLSDEGKLIAFTNNVAAILSIPTFAQISFSGPVVIRIRMDTINAVTISPNSGVNLRSFSNTTGARIMAGAGAYVTLYYRPDVGSNTWDMDGQLV